MNIFFDTVKNFLAPPVFEGDEEKTRVAALLNTILYSLIVLLVVINMILVVISLATKQAPPDPFVSVIATTVFIGLIILMRLGFVRQVSLLLSFVISGVITLSLARSENLIVVTSIGYIIAIITAGLLSGGWSALILALFNLLCLGGLNYAALQGITQTQPLAETDLITFGAFFSISVYLLALASRSIREALENARQSEKAQVEANQELRNLQANLEQRVADRTKALATSAEVSRRLASILDPGQLASAVVNEVQTAYNYYYAQIYLFDEAGEKLVLTAGTGDAGAEMMKRGHSLPKGRGLVGRAAETRESILVSDTSQDPDWLPNELLPDTKAEAVVPILIGDTVLGVLDVQDDVTNDIFSEDITLLESLAGQIAISLQNAASYARAEAALQEAKSLVENAPEAVVVVDLTTGLFTDPNKNAEKLYGLERDELVKVGPAQMSPPTQPDGRDSTEAAMEKIGEAMEGATPVFEWVHRNGQGKDVQCEIHLVRMPGDKPRVRATVIDITERKQLQEFTAQRARQQEAINTITQRIQSATTIEEAMQVAARELGHAVGNRQTSVALESSALGSNGKNASKE